MAFEPSDRQTLTAIPVKGVFPRITTWIGLCRNTMLRCYMTDFLRLFTPHLSDNQIERAARAVSQREVDQLINGTGLPVRNGIASKISASA